MRPLIVAIAALGIAGLPGSALADPIHVQVDGNITFVSPGLDGTFDQVTGFSFVFGWDPSRAHVAGPFQGGTVYSVPFTVDGTIGGQHVAVARDDFVEIPGGGGYVYFEGESTLIAGVERYGPNRDWGVRAFTLTLHGWGKSAAWNSRSRGGRACRLDGAVHRRRSAGVGRRSRRDGGRRRTWDHDVSSRDSGAIHRFGSATRRLRARHSSRCPGRPSAPLTLAQGTWCGRGQSTSAFLRTRGIESMPVSGTVLMMRPIRLLLVALAIGTSPTFSSAEPIYVRMDGTLTSISAGMNGAFDEAAGFSFVLGWDPTPAYIVGPLQGGVVYSVPFSVSGTIGGEWVEFATFDWTEIPADGSRLYFERESALVAGTGRYGPNDAWGIRAFLVTLHGWEPALTGIPDYVDPALFGSVEVYFAEAVESSIGVRAGADVGAVRGLTTAVHAVPEPASIFILLLGVCGLAGRAIPRSAPLEILIRRSVQVAAHSPREAVAPGAGRLAGQDVRVPD